MFVMTENIIKRPVYLREQGYNAPWFFFEAERFEGAKRFKNTALEDLRPS
jgi:hypothetical protein